MDLINKPKPQNIKFNIITLITPIINNHKMYKVNLLILFLTGLIGYSQGKKDIFNYLQNGDEINLKSFKPVGYEEDEDGSYFRYEFHDKDQFSFTIQNGVMIYLEINNMSQKATPAGVFNFNFKETKLSDIRNKFRSKGFVYEDNAYVHTEEQFLTFTCFEIKDTDLIISFVNIIDNEKFVKTTDNDDLMRKLELFTIIIAKKDYLSKIWGEKKLFPENQIYAIELK